MTKKEAPFDEVIFQEIPGKGGDIGKIILNRPQNLNALTFGMCAALQRQLNQWAKQAAIKAVIITGAGGRAFCAGGDVRAIYELCVQEKNPEKAIDFFQTEYTMNQTLFDFPKPYIAFLDGVTMGGGVGVSIHGSHPIATERLIWAMPETGLGFFPDVGVGYQLARLPGYAGFYLGLTGERINAAAAYQLGIVKAVVPQDQLQALEKALIDSAFSSDDFDAVTKIIMHFHQNEKAMGESKGGEAQLSPFGRLCELDSRGAKSNRENTPGQAPGYFEKTSQYFSDNSIEDIMEAWNNSSDSWCEAARTTLLAKSPLSLKVTELHLKHCKQLDFPGVIAENKTLSKHFLNSGEFMEGIRAILIDKDRRPHWRYNTLASVPPHLLEEYFS